jgi:hypothetical protein
VPPTAVDEITSPGDLLQRMLGLQTMCSTDFYTALEVYWASVIQTVFFSK